MNDLFVRVLALVFVIFVACCVALGKRGKQMGVTLKDIEGLRFAMMHVGPLEAACTLIYDSAADALAIVDPGGDESDIVNMVRKLRGSKTGPLAQSMILLTHARLLSFPTQQQQHTSFAERKRQRGLTRLRRNRL